MFWRVVSALSLLIREVCIQPIGKLIVKEIEAVISMPDFKGHLTDLGRPTANMYKMRVLI